MAKLRCEICGGKLIGNPGGIFVCDSCGMEYNTEWVKEQVQKIQGSVQIEGTVNVTGTVQVDNSSAINNYLQLAESALESNNHQLVLDYANRVLEISPDTALAWVYKGYSTDLSSTYSKLKYSEGLVYYQNAVRYAKPKEKNRIIDLILKYILSSLRSALKATAFQYSETLDYEYADCISSEVDFYQTHSEFIENNLTDSRYYNAFVLVDWHDAAAKILKEYTDKSIQKSSDKFNNIRLPKTRRPFDQYTNELHVCLRLYKLGLLLAEKPETAEQIIDKIIMYHDYFSVVSAYYWPDDFKRTAKLDNNLRAEHSQQVAEWKSKKGIILERCRNNIERAKLEQIKRNEVYWNQHSEERQALLQEKKELLSKMNPLCDRISFLNNNIKSIKSQKFPETPEESEKRDLLIYLEQIKRKKQSLFMAREKRNALNEQYQSIVDRLQYLDNIINQQKEDQAQQINAAVESYSAELVSSSTTKQSLQYRLIDIENELSQNR